MAITSLEELGAQVDAWAAGERRFVLGITGAPGAGKSTLAVLLAARAPARCAYVPMDGFHLANAELARLGRRDRKGAADTFDAAGYVTLLQRIRAATADDIVYAPEFRREIEEPIAGAIAVRPEQRLIITEGNYLLLDGGPWSAVRGLLDECWYIDIPAPLRLTRLVARHIDFGRSECAAREWVARSDEPNALLIASTSIRADRIIRLPER